MMNSMEDSMWQWNENSTSWVFPKIRLPQNGWWKYMENPIFQMDDLGGGFNPTIFGNTRIQYYNIHTIKLARWKWWIPWKIPNVAMKQKQHQLGVSKNKATPKWMVYLIMENPIFQMGWFGGSFNPTIFGNTRIQYYNIHTIKLARWKWWIPWKIPNVAMKQKQHQLGVSKNKATPKWMVYLIMENPIFQMGWFGGSFNPTIFGNTRIQYYNIHTIKLARWKWWIPWISHMAMKHQTAPLDSRHLVLCHVDRRFVGSMYCSTILDAKLPSWRASGACQPTTSKKKTPQFFWRGI